MIPVHQISPSSWEAAIQMFNMLSSFTLPCEKVSPLPYLPPFSLPRGIAGYGDFVCLSPWRDHVMWV